MVGSFFSILFHVWFYCANLIAILVLFPLIFFSSWSSKTHKLFFTYERIWAKIVLALCGYRYTIDWQEKLDKDKQYIICPNHTSMLDIMLTLAVFPNHFMFIGKKELSKMPLFGYFYSRTNILVDRSSISSRKQSFKEAGQKMDEGVGLCIYPEGLAPREEITLSPFKPGAFKLATDKNVPVVPVSFLDCKRLFPFDFRKGKPGVLRVIVHPFLKPNMNKQDDSNRLKSECYNVILQSLQKHNFH